MNALRQRFREIRGLMLSFSFSALYESSTAIGACCDELLRLDSSHKAKLSPAFLCVIEFIEEDPDLLASLIEEPDYLSCNVLSSSLLMIHNTR